MSGISVRKFTAVVLCILASPLAAQQAALVEAANSITAADLARQLSAITADSLGGRDTPSRGLELTAQYLVAEFGRLGLISGTRVPLFGRDTVSWVIRYNLPGSQYLSRSQSEFDFAAAIPPESGPEEWLTDRTTLDSLAWLASELVDANVSRGGINRSQVIVVAGQQTPRSVRRAGMKDKCIIYVPPVGIDSLREWQMIEALQMSSVGVAVPGAEDSMTFVHEVQASQLRPARLVDRYMERRMGVRSWVVYVWPSLIRKFLLHAGLDLERLRVDATPIIREVPFYCAAHLVPDRAMMSPSTATAPNVVVELTGSDPKLKDEYIVYTAHMDNAGTSGGPGDNAAGVAGLLALAKAFSQPGARPKRSVLFIATSGGVKDWWGVRYLETEGRGYMPSGIEASLHLDNLDHATDDSVVVDGVRDFAALRSPVWLATLHPELGVTVVDGGSVDRSLDNHGAFLMRLLPSLAFHRRVDGDYQAPAGSRPMNEDYLARVLRLAFYTGYDMANGTAAPRWSEDSRRELRQLIAYE